MYTAIASGAMTPLQAALMIVLGLEVYLAVLGFGWAAIRGDKMTWWKRGPVGAALFAFFYVFAAWDAWDKWRAHQRDERHAVEVRRQWAVYDARQVYLAQEQVAREEL